jgi:hypothetical protein
VIAFLFSTVTAASAQPGASDALQPSRSTDDWIDRPLLLPQGQLRVGAAVDASPQGSEMDVTAGEALTVSAAVGVHPRAQLGIAFTELVDPSAFGAVSGSAVLGYDEHTAVRIDAGVSRTTSFVIGDPSFPTSTTTYSFALGAPVEFKLSPHVAFVSGSTGRTGFGLPYADHAPQGISTAAGPRPTYFGESIVAVLVKDGAATQYILSLPAGILVAPTERVAIRLHGAYQFIHSGVDEEGWPVNNHFLVAGAELLISLPAHLDVGASIDTVVTRDTTSRRYEYNWSDGRGTQLGLWMQGRFGS